jgi:tetratricopeptide (TPR) repeat protein
VGRTEVKSSVLVIRACSRGIVYDGHVRVLALLSLLGLSACASSVPRTVPRLVDGQIEDGPAVSPYAYEWFIEGERQAARGRHGDAAIAFETAMAAPTGDVLLLMRLAEEYEVTGASRKADRVLSLARRYYPQSARVSLAEGRILLLRDDADGAFASFIVASRRAPGWAAPVVEMSTALAARGHVERANALLLEFLEDASDAQANVALSALLDLSRRHEDAETFGRALRFERGSTPSERSAKATRFALSSDQPALAARIAGPNPESEEATELWLEALRQSGHRAEAADYLASPDAARMARVEDRAAGLVELGAEERALELLVAADGTPRVQLSRGTALAASGSYVQGATELAKVPWGSSTFEASRLALAECTEANRRSGAAAEALSLAPHGSLAVRERLATLLVDNGELNAALRLFDPRQSADRAALAALFERMGRYDEASAYYATVRATTRSEPRLRARTTAEQLAAQGLRDSAITVLEQWSAMAPEDLYARARLIELLNDERRVDEARRRGQEALPLITDPKLRAHVRGLVGPRVGRN